MAAARGLTAAASSFCASPCACACRLFAAPCACACPPSCPACEAVRVGEGQLSLNALPQSSFPVERIVCTAGKNLVRKTREAALRSLPAAVVTSYYVQCGCGIHAAPVCRRAARPGQTSGGRSRAVAAGSAAAARAPAAATAATAAAAAAAAAAPPPALAVGNPGRLPAPGSPARGTCLPFSLLLLLLLLLLLRGLAAGLGRGAPVLLPLLPLLLGSSVCCGRQQPHAPCLCLGPYCLQVPCGVGMGRGQLHSSF
jgi:hypothetical protein